MVSTLVSSILGSELFVLSVPRFRFKAFLSLLLGKGFWFQVLVSIQKISACASFIEKKLFVAILWLK